MDIGVNGPCEERTSSHLARSNNPKLETLVTVRVFYIKKTYLQYYKVTSEFSFAGNNKKL